MYHILNSLQLKYSTHLNIILKFHLRYIFLILILSNSFVLLSQVQLQVHGLAIDKATEKPMPFVNIAVVGSTYGTVSNQNGEFTINLNKISQTDSIAFHFIGYETITRNIRDLIDGITIKMEEKKE